MWSAAGVFTLSLAGQSAARLVGVKVMTAFANGMPVIVLALIALLVHLRQLDRADRSEAEEAARSDERARSEEAAEASELAVLRAALETAQAGLATAQADRADAQRGAQETAAKAEVAERKLASLRAKSARSGKGAAAPRGKGADPRATEVPSDVDAQAEALSILAAEPGISGAQLGPRVGKSKRWGQDFKKNLAGSSAGPDERPDESA
jgi:hypothetical protein